MVDYFKVHCVEILKEPSTIKFEKFSGALDNFKKNGNIYSDEIILYITYPLKLLLKKNINNERIVNEDIIVNVFNIYRKIIATYCNDKGDLICDFVRFICNVVSSIKQKEYKCIELSDYIKESFISMLCYVYKYSYFSILKLYESNNFITFATLIIIIKKMIERTNSSIVSSSGIRFIRYFCGGCGYGDADGDGDGDGDGYISSQPFTFKKIEIISSIIYTVFPSFCVLILELCMKNTSTSSSSSILGESCKTFLFFTYFILCNCSKLKMYSYYPPSLNIQLVDRAVFLNNYLAVIINIIKICINSRDVNIRTNALYLTSRTILYLCSSGNSYNMDENMISLQLYQLFILFVTDSNIANRNIFHNELLILMDFKMQIIQHVTTKLLLLLNANETASETANETANENEGDEDPVTFLNTFNSIIQYSLVLGYTFSPYSSFSFSSMNAIENTLFSNLLTRFCELFSISSLKHPLHENNSSQDNNLSLDMNSKITDNTDLYVFMNFNHIKTHEDFLHAQNCCQVIGHFSCLKNIFKWFNEDLETTIHLTLFTLSKLEIIKNLLRGFYRLPDRYIADIHFDMNNRHCNDEIDDDDDLIIKSVHTIFKLDNLTSQNIFNMSSLSHFYVNVLNQLGIHTIKAVEETTPPLDRLIKIEIFQIVSLSSLCLKQKFKHLLPIILFPILLSVGSPDAICSYSAKISINAISTSCGYISPKHLISHNVDYIIDACRRRLETLYGVLDATCILRVLINLFPSKELVNHLMVDCMFTLLRIVDNYQDTGLCFVIETFSSYIDSIEKLYSPDGVVVASKSVIFYKELDEKEDLISYFLCMRSPSMLDEDPSSNICNEAVDSSNPIYIKLIKNIVDKCSHFITSSSEMLSIHAIDVCNKGLGNLINYDDERLPLVHKVWIPIMFLLRSSMHHNTFPAIVRLVTSMTLHSSSFINMRLSKEFLPSIISVMQYNYNDDYKTTTASSLTLTNSSRNMISKKSNLEHILRGIKTIIKNMDLKESDIFKIQNICCKINYESTSISLQSIASDVLMTISKF